MPGKYCRKNDLITTTLAKRLCSIARRLGATGTPLGRNIMRLVRTLALLLFAAIAGVSEASAQLVSITIAPPVLPVYEQPPIPGPGYIWTPGYWAWGDDGYYWVPGTWVLPPAVGLLWTPGYWGWRDGIYVWNAGYWGPHIGFYGGINYGFGYTGVGYAGGFWRGGVFQYNRTVNNFGGVHITNAYSKTVINNTNVTNVSFNGGAGGTNAKATPQELAAANEQHMPPTQAQTQHQNLASTNPAMHASNNGGHPQVAATSHAGQFNGPGVVGAKTAATGPTGGNPAGGATGNRGPTGAPNTPARPVTGAPGTGGGPKTNTANVHAPNGPNSIGPTGGGPRGPNNTASLNRGGPPGAGPGGPSGPARFTGGGPNVPRTANVAAPRNFGPPGGAPRFVGGRGPRPGGGGGPRPAPRGPAPHH
jgi:hypothetical protein